MTWKTLDDMDLTGKTVLTRIDINVPMENGVVTDSTRIDRIVPTVQEIIKRGGKPVLLAHFGRPKGVVVPEMSLKHVVPALTQAMGVPVSFAEDCIGLPAKKAVAALRAGEVLLLENTRFHEAETKNDRAFAASLAALGDIYCNDAFSAAHRAHGSTEGIAQLLPSCAGRLMQAELEALEAALSKPSRPVVAVVGGAKVSSKLDLLGNLVEKVEFLIIGGGMANTFLAAKGLNVGTSLCERDLAETAREIMTKAKNSGCEVVLPKDIVVAQEFKENAPHAILAVEDCPDVGMILDAGPESTKAIINVFEHCSTLIWNGPLGAFEIAPFDTATNAAAAKAAELTRAGSLISVAGGGDTVAALNKSDAAKGFSYISTAGGAFLEWMEGKTLPGVAALDA
ncbi:phosphoglycerate kinase [Pseudohalocynthiibacter aestuariivivens]|uniref:Phosphoglycerate kinase n=1 Tax=Pseudohalocynthiibacter aestuariivivens TaxID=1591409 RepID=A0ABV5JIP6_9RHOB|nr:phosphoglycerate kinase [Pseudohalocynthiibacter aestuariivivens]MBS9716572.1 phosphoglycerate kinase [Pseudohalocynthiibacter aestuariivivens]